MKANDTQVGGTHYGGRDLQHWDWISDHMGVSYLIGCATKYLCRYKNKNGAQDIQKAKHYLEKLVEKLPATNWSDPGVAPYNRGEFRDKLNTLQKEYQMDPRILEVCTWVTRLDQDPSGAKLPEMLFLLDTVIKEESK